MLKCFYILIWITAFKLSFCQRRMGLGNESVMGKKYLVYFVQSPYSNSDDDAWLCAGAIVTPTQILTAAACLVEINRIYAIAGYKKYVHARNIEKDKCANMSKKKVVKISVPKDYISSNNKELEWMNVDIGVATVQEPYNFSDQSYLTHCSYVPESITINYDKNNELENTRAIALGWGGKKDPKELPEETLKWKLLQEATTTIMEKTFCANLLPKNGSKEIVYKYLLCASGNGFLGEDGEETTLDTIFEKQSTNSSIFLNNATKNINQSNEMSSRKSALVETCQNDHGGPLVSWVGNQEMILGVALNGICNPNFDCVGPRIYVSTAATAQIIKCLLETNDTRRKTCNQQMGDKLYQVNDIEIKWPKNLKINSTSSLSIQKNPSLRRQNNEEGTLHVRPTKDLRTFNKQKNPKEKPQDNSYEKLQENSRKNRQENPNQQSYNEQQQRYMSQKQIESQSQPEIDSFNQPQMESQNQPEIYSLNQQQMESYNQPPLDPYYNQPPMDLYNNQPQMESTNPPESESYNQPQTQSNNQQKQKIPYQPQMDLFNKPHKASQNYPQRPINKDELKSNQPLRSMNITPPPKPPQMEPLMPSQVHLFNQPQIESFQQPQAELFNEGQTDQLQFSSFKKPPPKPFNKPPAESLNNSELGSLKSPQSNVDPLGQSQYSYKEPQSSYSQSKLESVETKPTESYNPLDIIMADDDDAFKRPMGEPYMSPHAALRKQPSIDSDMPQPFKPELYKPFEQPHLSKKYQPQSPHHDQPLGQPVEQAPAQLFNPGQPLNPLRSRPQDSVSNPSQGDTQTFEQMFSQLHAEPDPSASAPPPDEETFDELYKNLHDGRPEGPQDQEFEPRLDQPIEQQVEQTDTKVVNEPTKNEPHNDVQVRQQVPLEYRDY